MSNNFILKFFQTAFRETCEIYVMVRLKKKRKGGLTRVHAYVYTKTITMLNQLLLWTASLHKLAKYLFSVCSPCLIQIACYRQCSPSYLLRSCLPSAHSSPPPAPNPHTLSDSQRHGGAPLLQPAELRRVHHHRRPHPHHQAAVSSSRQSLQHHPRHQPSGFNTRQRCQDAAVDY